MTRPWLLFYGHQIGMNRQEIMTTRIGEMLDLISCLAVYHGAKEAEKKMSFDEFMALR